MEEEEDGVDTVGTEVDDDDSDDEDSEDEDDGVDGTATTLSVDEAEGVAGVEDLADDDFVDDLGVRVAAAAAFCSMRAICANACFNSRSCRSASDSTVISMPPTITVRRFLAGEVNASCNRSASEGLRRLLLPPPSFLLRDDDEDGVAVEAAGVEGAFSVEVEADSVDDAVDSEPDVSPPSVTAVAVVDPGVETVRREEAAVVPVIGVEGGGGDGDARRRAGVCGGGGMLCVVVVDEETGSAEVVAAVTTSVVERDDDDPDKCSSLTATVSPVITEADELIAFVMSGEEDDNEAVSPFAPPPESSVDEEDVDA